MLFNTLWKEIKFPHDAMAEKQLLTEAVIALIQSLMVGIFQGEKKNQWSRIGRYKGVDLRTDAIDTG